MMLIPGYLLQLPRLAIAFCFLSSLLVFGYFVAGRLTHISPPAIEHVVVEKIVVDKQAEADRRQLQLTARNLADRLARSDAPAQARARRVYDEAVWRAREDALARIDRDFVSPYFSFGSDLERSAKCVIRLGFCGEILRQDFEQHFGKIDNSVLMEAWRQGADLALRAYVERKQDDIRRFSAEHHLSEKQFGTLLATLDIKPMAAAMGLFENRMPEIALLGFKAIGFANRANETIRDSLARARTTALPRAEQMLASEAVGAAEARILKSAVLRAIGEAAEEWLGPAVIAAGEIYAAHVRETQRAEMMAVFRNRIETEEKIYFLTAMANARDASPDKYFVTALIRFSGSRQPPPK